MTPMQIRRRYPLSIDIYEADDHSTRDFGVPSESIDRQLATLRFENQTSADGEDDSAGGYIYRPSGYVARMHRAPRGVGNTHRLASVLMDSSSGGNAYIDGLKLFVGFFIITPFVIWLVVLVALKLKYQYYNKKGKVMGGQITSKGTTKIPTPKTALSDDTKAKLSIRTGSQFEEPGTTTIIPTTSWIAGGEIINMIELSKVGVPRKDRKELVLRAWRIQSTFLSVSMLIPVLSIVLMELGWKPLEQAIQEIQQLNEDVETLAYRGWSAVDGLESSREKLFAENELVRSVLSHSSADASEPDQKPHKGRKRNGKDNRRRAQLLQHLWGETLSPTMTSTSEFDTLWDDAPFDMPATSSSYDKDEILGSARIDDQPKPPWHDGDSSQLDITVQELSNSKDDNKYSVTESTSVVSTSGIFVDDWCPDAVKFIGVEELNYWTDSIDNLTMKSHKIENIFNSLEDFFPSMKSTPHIQEEDESLFGESSSPSHTSSAFRFVTDTTTYIDEHIKWFFANDWILKLLVVILNVINGLLLANVYFVSKNDIIHQPTRLYVAYVLLPLFFAAAVSMVVVAVAAGVAVLVNSDFCSGGSGIGGPQKTIEDAIQTLQQQQQQQQQQQTNKKNSGSMQNGALDLVYDAVEYYWTGCLTENPLQFLEDFADEIDDADAKINDLSMLLPIDDSSVSTNGLLLQPEVAGQGSSTTSTSKTTLATLNKACQRDMSFLPPSIEDLKIKVDQIRTNIHKLSNTMSCGQVSPLLRRVSHGAVCVESPQSLTIMWGASFGIAVLCFVLLTVRAALFNSVIYKKKRKMKPRRIVEKEFEEYKEYMGRYYGEETTRKWKIDGIPLPPTKLELEFDEDIELKGTFETVEFSQCSGDDGQNVADGSEIGGIFIRDADDEDDSSYGSSYDSECSDDEKSVDSEKDEQSSAIGSFLSETKSIAMQTLHTLRNAKSLLTNSKIKRNLPQHIGNTNLHINDPNFNESHEEEQIDYDKQFLFSHQLDDVSDIGDEKDDENAEVDDGKSIANSISDESMYLPTPKNAAPRLGKAFEKKKLLTLSKDDGFSDEDELNDTEDQIVAGHSLAMSNHSWTPTNFISAISPAAPRKALSYLARTLYTGTEQEDYTEDELHSLVQPRALANLNSFRSNERHSTIRRGSTTKSFGGKPKPTSRHDQSNSRGMLRR